MTLREYLDDNFRTKDVRVLSPSGAELGTVLRSEEETAFALGPHMGDEVVKEVPVSPTLSAVYVSPGPDPIGERVRLPSVGYVGELADEAAFSADWRSRERKASAAQLRIIRGNMGIYRSIKKDYWPDDPAQLLAYEASDAITEIKRTKGGNGR